MLKFLGDGGAIDIKRGNTNAYYKNNDYLLLIDCGSNAYIKIMELHLLDGVKKLDILITHLHADHFGGLASLCDYLCIANEYMGTGIEYSIYYPDYKNIETILTLMHIKDIRSHLYSPLDLKFVKQIVKAEHFTNSYGYILNLNGKNIYYSGDNSHINKNVLKEFLNGDIDYFYHEVTNMVNPYHTHFSEFDELIPQNLRSKVYCMHLNDETSKIVSNLGFNIIDNK